MQDDLIHAGSDDKKPIQPVSEDSSNDTVDI